MAGGRAPGAVHHRFRLAEGDGGAAARAARGPCYQGDLARQRCNHAFATFLRGTLPGPGHSSLADTSRRVQVIEQPPHVLRPLDVGEVAAARDGDQLGLRDDLGQPGQIRRRREHIAVPAGRQHRAADAAPVAKVVVRRGPGGSAKAGGPGVVAEPADHAPGYGCGVCEKRGQQQSHDRGGADRTDQCGPGRAERRHGAHEQQHAGKRRESGQAAQRPPGRLGHAESGGRNGGDAGGPLRPGSGNVQCQESSHGVAHQVPPPVAERMQNPRDSPCHRLDAEMFQPGTLRGFAPAGQINEHPGTGRHTGKQREEAGPGPRGAVKVDIRCAGRGRRAFGALLDTHRAGAQFRGKDIPAQRGRFLAARIRAEHS